MDVQLLQGKRAGSFIYHVGDGWYYHVNRRKPNILYLKCIHYDSLNCTGRAVVRRHHGFDHVSPHNTHNSDVAYADELKLVQRILQRCRNLEYLPYRHIVAEERRRFNREVRSRVTLVRLRTAMRNARISNFPPPPQDLRGLTDILQNPQFEVLTLTLDGEDNIYAGSVTDVNGDHHVIFCSERMLRFMSTARFLHGDGTIKTVPTIDGVQQIFCIVTTWRHHIIPLAWVLMESQTQQAYEAVLQMIHDQLQPPIRVRTIVTDYERAQQNAWENTFPNVHLQGCLWHLCRAFVRKFVQLGHQQHLRNTPEVKMLFRLCCALPLLPQDSMYRGLQVIIREAMAEGRAIYRVMRPFFRYILSKWLMSPARTRWMSVHGSDHRTNNANESHNMVLKDVVGGHQNIYIFMNKLAGLENDAYTDLLTLQVGRAASRKRRATAISNDRRLRALEQDLRQRAIPRRMAILNFLRAGGHLLDNIVDNALEDYKH